MDRSKSNASGNSFPTKEQRKKLIECALEFARLLPPGADRTHLLEVGRTLSFFADKGDDPANRTSSRGQPFSIVRGRNNVVEIKMSSVLLHEIKRGAEKENVPLGQAITTWVKHAIKSDLIGLH
jgi:hypothetical protein